MGHAVKYIIFLGMMLLLTLSLPYFLSSEHKFWKTQGILLGVFAAIIAFGVFESITLLHLPSSRGFGFDSAIVTSVFNNQNDLASCITLAIPFLITALYMLDLSKETKVVYLLCRCFFPLCTLRNRIPKQHLFCFAACSHGNYRDSSVGGGAKENYQKESPHHDRSHSIGRHHCTIHVRRLSI